MVSRGVSGVALSWLSFHPARKERARPCGAPGGGLSRRGLGRVAMGELRNGRGSYAVSNFFGQIEAAKVQQGPPFSVASVEPPLGIRALQCG